MVQKNLKKVLESTAGLCLALALTLTACDTTNLGSTQNSDEVNAPVAAMIDELDLTNDQAEQIVALTERMDSDTPGRLWYVAAELQQTLTDEQKTELMASVSNQERAMRDKVMRNRPDGAKRGGMGMRGFENLSTPLTEEQKSQLETLRDEQRTKAQALMQARRDGSKSSEEIRAEAEVLREGMRASLSGILTEEQVAELETQREARQERIKERRDGAEEGRGRNGRGMRGLSAETRDAFGSAMEEALGLTDTQLAELAALHESQREKMKALREQARDGEGNRDAMRESFETMRSELTASRNDILTEEQQEVVTIHRALMVQHMERRMEESGQGRNIK